MCFSLNQPLNEETKKNQMRLSSLKLYLSTAKKAYKQQQQIEDEYE